MINEEALARNNALEKAADRVQTTRMRYAVQKNLREVQRLLEPYQETLQQIVEEHEVEDLQDPPEPAEEKINELLEEEAGEMEAHQVPPSVLDREDEQGTDLPMSVIAGVDWMIKD